MNQAQFRKIVSDGIFYHKKYMIVKIYTEGFSMPEIIINPSENFEEKIRYYLGAYNDNMELISAKKNGTTIKIIDVLMTSSLLNLYNFVHN